MTRNRGLEHPVGQEKPIDRLDEFEHMRTLFRKHVLYDESRTPRKSITVHEANGVCGRSAIDG